jgi:hypothetical protein
MKPSLLSTEALYERRRVTISGDGYLTSKNISAPGAYLLASDDVLFCCEVNKDKSKMKEDDKLLVFLILCPKVGSLKVWWRRNALTL